MEEIVISLLKDYTYQPMMVYSLVALVMLLSSLGLPVPEEVSIVSLGILSYVGSNPDLYPPPYPEAPHVDVVPAMLVCSLSIFLSDFLIYSIGRQYGPVIFTSDWFQKLVPEKRLKLVKAWARKWGGVVPGIFRLIPGVRFPGHLICGALGIKRRVFILVDGLVILVIVPTQIFLISYYGETVIRVMKRFQFVLVGLCVAILAGLLWNFYKIFKKTA